MSDSPLLRRARERLAKQRQEERDRWETQPAALRKSMLRLILRVVAIFVLMGLLVFRLNGGSFY
jgi:hypothetical protein